MPFIVARPVVSFLRRSVHTKKRGSRAAECDQQVPPSDGDCHTPLPCEVRRGQRYHAASLLSLTARHLARAERTPGTGWNGAPPGLISRNLFLAGPLHFISDLREDIDARGFL